jgi:hypothetical protein
MNEVTLGIVFLLMIYGCAKEQDLKQKSASVAPVQEVKQIEPTQPVLPSRAEEIVKQEAGVVEEKIIEAGTEVTSTPDESGFQVAPPVAIVQEMQAQVKKVQQQKALVKPAEGAEEIIAENRWGFSIYDPQTGIEEFFTIKGTLLGSKTR